MTRRSQALKQRLPPPINWNKMQKLRFIAATFAAALCALALSVGAALAEESTPRPASRSREDRAEVGTDSSARSKTSSTSAAIGPNRVDTRRAVARKRADAGRPWRDGSTARTVTLPPLARTTRLIVADARRVRVMRCPPLVSVVTTS